MSDQISLRHPSCNTWPSRTRFLSHLTTAKSDDFDSLRVVAIDEIIMLFDKPVRSFRNVVRLNWQSCPTA